MPRRPSTSTPRHPDHDRIYGPQAVARWYRIANLAAFSTYLGVVTIIPIGLGIEALSRRFPRYDPQLEIVELIVVISLGLAYLTHLLTTPILLMRCNPESWVPTSAIFVFILLMPLAGLILYILVVLSARSVLKAHGYEVRMLSARLSES